MQEVLVELVGSRVAYKLFEFNGATKPLQRHKLIKEFQNDVNDQPCVFTVTCARAPAPNALLQTRCSHTRIAQWSSLAAAAAPAPRSVGLCSDCTQPPLSAVMARARV